MSLQSLKTTASLRCLLSVAIGAMLSLPAVAQTQKQTDARKSVLTDPSLSSIALDGSQSIVLEASEEGAKLIGKLGYAPQDKPWIFNLKLSADANKDGDTDLASIDGLPGGTVASASVTYEWVKTRKDSAGDLVGICEKGNDRVLADFYNKRPNYQPIDIDAKKCSVSAFNKRGGDWASNADDIFDKTLIAVCRAYNKSGDGPPLGFLGDFDETKGAKLPACSKEALIKAGWGDEFAAELTKNLKVLCEEYNAVPADKLINVFTGECEIDTLYEKHPNLRDEALAASGWIPFYFTIEASASTDTFSFADPMTFEQSSDSKTNRSVSIAAGTVYRRYGLSLGYRSQRVHTGGAAQQICQPIDMTTTLSCKDLVLTPPLRTDREIARFDAKWYLSQNLGSSVQLIYDFEQSDFNPHWLLYFLRHQTKGINGGIGLSYDSGDEEIKARVFIGTAFSLF